MDLSLSHAFKESLRVRHSRHRDRLLLVRELSLTRQSGGEGEVQESTYETQWSPQWKHERESWLTLSTAIDYFTSTASSSPIHISMGVSVFEGEHFFLKDAVAWRRLS